MKKKFLILCFIILIVLVWLVILNKNQISNTLNVENISPTEAEKTTVEDISTNLEIPWGMVFLPDKSILVTERPGRVRLISSNGETQKQPVLDLPSVKAIGEGGLLGITLHPNFLSNKYIYLYYTYGENFGNTLNRVVRMTYEDNKLKDEQIIVDKIPGASNHNGGRIKFGPDGYLYITTGDAQKPSQAQDIKTLGGKILRVTEKGNLAPGNPFNNLVYSYGHRNPQGLAWDNDGRLWATEHGRSGVLSGLDELNLIEKGKNYGWPVIEGDEEKDGMEAPRLNSGSANTWAPAGLEFANNSLYFGGLRGKALYKVTINKDKLTLKENYKNEYGRIRDVVLGLDNQLYIATSNRDGRGTAELLDDRIIRINLNNL